SFRSPIFQHRGLVVSSMAHWRNRTLVFLVQRNFLFAKRHARPPRAMPNATRASRYGALESRDGDRRLLKRAPPRRAPARDLPQVRLDEQKRRHASVYQSPAIDRLPYDHAQAHEAVRDLQLVRPFLRKTVFDRERYSVRPVFCRGERFQRLVRSPKNRSQQISLDRLSVPLLRR